MKNIVIFGAGEIGTAFAHLLKKNRELTIELWDKDPSKAPNQKELSEITQNADAVFLCICSWSLRECTESIKAHLPKNTLLISPTKGVEKQSHQFVSEFLKENFPQNPIAIIVGPMLGEEIIEDLPAKALCASDKATFEKVRDLFKESDLTLNHTDDLLSVCITSVLKNIYAVSLGIVDALNLGHNAKGAVLTQALEEMELILKALGGDPEITLSLAGAGDLVATSYSPYSRNRFAGAQLVEKGVCDNPGEGMVSFPSLLSRLDPSFQYPPLLSALKKVLMEKTDATKTFLELIHEPNEY